MKDIRELLRGDITAAPCIFCGYLGARYWQRHSHSNACPWYEVGGSQDRGDIIKKVKGIEELGYRKLPDKESIRVKLIQLIYGDVTTDDFVEWIYE